MKNKGFTLIELLGVIIILSLLILLVLPSITGSVKNYSKDTDELMLSMVVDATKLYVEDNSVLYRKKNGRSYCIELTELVDNEYLKLPIKQNDLDITNTKSVQVTYEDGFNYEVVDKDECEEIGATCKLAQNGDVDPAGISVGDKYICKVKNNMEKGFEDGYTFFVLGTNVDGTTNLILERNMYYDYINQVGILATEETYAGVSWYGSPTTSIYGPVKSMTYLHDTTKDWVNVPNIQMNYKDEGDRYGTIITENNVTKITKKDGTTVTATFENLKARMPMLSEVSDYDSEKKTNAYLYNYLSLHNNIQTNSIVGINQYNILSSHDSYEGKAVSNIGSVTNCASGGVRPVITIEIE